MRGYFTTNSRNFELNKQNIDFIYSVVRDLGHKIDEFNKHDANLDYSKDSEESLVRAYSHISKSIKSCDFVIAELSSKSTRVGYEIALALSEKKPVLILYNEKTNSEKFTLSTPISGNKSKYLIVKKYSTKKDIESSIKFFMKDISELISTKFILIIPAEINKYLEWNVKEKGTSKAEITRKAIENMMKNDKDYTNYLKSFSSFEGSS